MKLSTIYKAKKFKRSMYPLSDIMSLIQRDDLEEDAIDEVDEGGRLEVRNIIDLYDDGNATTTDLCSIFFDGVPVGVYTAHGHEDSVDVELYLSSKNQFKILNDYLDTKRVLPKNVYVDAEFDMIELNRVGYTNTDEYVLELNLQLLEIGTTVDISSESFADCFENKLPEKLKGIIRNANEKSQNGAYFVEIIDNHLEYKVENGQIKTILISDKEDTWKGYALSDIPSLNTFATLIPSNGIITAYEITFE